MGSWRSSKTVPLLLLAGAVVLWEIATLGPRADFVLPPTEIARDVVGAVASLAAGVACVAMGRSARAAIYLFALLLLALFVPVHVALWAKFPVWYHIVFLGSLVPLVVLGAKLPSSRGISAA